MRNAISILAVVTVFVAAGVHAQGQVAPNEVRLCEHENYQGLCTSFFLEPGMRHRLVHQLPSALNDRVSSVQIGASVELYVFRHSNFLGASKDFKINAPSFQGHGSMEVCGDDSGQSWNDQISSLIMTWAGRRCSGVVGRPSGAVEGVYVFSDLKTGSECPEAYYPLPEDQASKEARFPQLGHYMDDRGSVLYACGYLEVELYPAPHLKGAPVKLRSEPADVELMRFAFADYDLEHKVSSLVVRSRTGNVEIGQTPLMLPPERNGEAAGEPHRAPPAGPKEAIVAGPITAPSAGSLAFEHDTNRPGHDYHNFKLGEARPELCRDACAKDPRCKAFTYVKPGVQGQQAHCWLKDLAERPQPGACCISGIKK